MSIQTETADQTTPTAVAKAQSVVDKWTEKASAAREEAQRVDRESGAQILENPAAAEKITTKVLTLERQARAYDSAATEAKAQVRKAWQDAIAAEAKELDKSAVSMRREAARIEADTEKLIDKLEALQGVRYVPKIGKATHVDAGNVYRPDDGAPRETKSQDLEARAEGAESQAALARWVLETGSASSFPGQPSLGYLTTPPTTKAALESGVL
ncbi:MAG: hypothetical protein ACTH2U_08445 [Brevibacterium sp.]